VTIVARRATHEHELDELRLALRDMLAAHRRLRGRDGRQPGSIGYAQYPLLAALRREGELTSSGLAGAADLAPATVTQMLDVLEAAGLVQRQRDSADRRVVLVRLTALGRRSYDAKHAELVAAWNHELSDLDTESLRAASVVLQRLGAFLDGL
jgi:DNA-binding MarR family transcriptional regulator